MGLRLFHVTEFAQSALTPTAQREASHPCRLLLLASLWLAIAGNLPLWRELSRLPMDLSQLLWIGLCIVLLSTGAMAALLTLINWPWLLKLAVTTLWWLAVLNTALLWHAEASTPSALLQPGWRAALAQLLRGSHWQLAAFGILAFLPALMLWRATMRRVSLPHLLPQNILCLLLCCSFVVLVWFAGRQSLLPLIQDQPRWLELLNPFNTLLNLWHRI